VNLVPKFGTSRRTSAAATADTKVWTRRRSANRPRDKSVHSRIRSVGNSSDDAVAARAETPGSSPRESRHVLASMLLSVQVQRTFRPRRTADGPISGLRTLPSTKSGVSSRDLVRITRDACRSALDSAASSAANATNESGGERDRGSRRRLEDGPRAEFGERWRSSSEK
jgi:hypothetical protein